MNYNWVFDRILLGQPARSTRQVNRVTPGFFFFYFFFNSTLFQLQVDRIKDQPARPGRVLKLWNIGMDMFKTLLIEREQLKDVEIVHFVEIIANRNINLRTKQSFVTQTQLSNIYIYKSFTHSFKIKFMLFY
jgi:hypothetical protein